MNSVKLSHRKRFAVVAIALSLFISLPFTALLIREVAAPTTHQVNITNFAFVPQNLTISPGDSILWNNTDEVIHTLWFVYVANESTYLLSDPIPPDTTWTHTFNEAVELQYYSFDKLWITGFINVTGEIHDIAVTNVTTSKSGCLGVGNGAPYPVLCQGRTAKVYVTVENEGDFTELFEVSAYCNDSTIPIHEQWPTLTQSETFWTMGDVNKDGYINICDMYLIEANYGWTGPPGENPADIDQDGDVDVYDMVICAANQGLDIWTYFGLSTIIGEATLVNLPNGSSTTITFRWNATGWAKGNYTIKAVADHVAGEIDTTDNTFIDAWVMVVHPGDLDNSCEVDITDVVMVTGIYRAKIGDPEYNACRDVVEDCVIDISDVVAVTGHYREVC